MRDGQQVSGIRPGLAGIRCSNTQQATAGQPARAVTMAPFPSPCPPPLAHRASHTTLCHPLNVPGWRPAPCAGVQIGGVQTFAYLDQNQLSEKLV